MHLSIISEPFHLISKWCAGRWDKPETVYPPDSRKTGMNWKGVSIGQITQEGISVNQYLFSFPI